MRKSVPTIASERTDITPQNGLPLFGRQGRTASSENCTSSLEANIILIGEESEEFALISIDSLYPSARLTNQIRKSLSSHGWDLPEAHLLTIASHTHNAPALDDSKPLLGKLNETYLREVAEKISACLISCRAKKGVEFEMEGGASKCETSVFRRRFINGFDFKSLRPKREMIMAPRNDEPIDQHLKLAALSDPQGTCQAVICSWPCHAVSESQTMSISADFPHYIRHRLRQLFDNAELPILYLPGFSGDIRPATLSKIPIHKTLGWVGIGPRFASNNSTSDRALRMSLDTAIKRAFEDLKPLPSSTRSKIETRHTELAMNEIRTGTDNLPPISFDGWQIGPLKIVAISAEISSRYRNRPNDGNPAYFETGCAEQVFGYIPTDNQIAEGGYEAGGFETAFSVPGCFRNSIEPTIRNAIDIAI